MDNFQKFLNNSKNQIIKCFLTCLVAFIFSAIVTGIPLLKETFFEFFVKNERILDIYWNTLLILLTILIPIGIEMIQFFKERFPKFGYELFFKDKDVGIERFYWLIPLLSFTFLFSLFYSEQGKIDRELLVFSHSLMFYLWMTMFWYVFRILSRSIKIMMDNGESINEIFYQYLKNIPSSNEIDSLTDRWSAVWETFGALSESRRKKFFILFWNKQRQYFDKREYDCVTDLFKNFSASFLSIKDKESQKNVTWFNERKKWYWFHNIKFNDGTENPYAIFPRLLNFHFLVYTIWQQYLAEPDKGTASHSFGVAELSHTIESALEDLIDNELENSQDSYYGFFKLLKEHVAVHAEDKDYLEELPVYRAVFEYSDNYLLQEDVFPEEWQIGINSVDNLFGASGDELVRWLWYREFFEWAQNRIDHGKQKFDNKLDGALVTLFPKTYKPWLALSFGYLVLTWSGDRIDSLCRWERNFGSGFYIGLGGFYDSSKTDAENELEMAIKDAQRQEEIKKNTVLIIKKLGMWGKPEEMREKQTQLEALELTYGNDPLAKQNAGELIELMKRMREII